ncbi:nitrate ABC transporter ATP-binding protein [Pseudoxanthomonas broegbernensis]|uniref:Nitrate ABC transporter ATP-binding protein n=1 Tax=Pseudoxanthomonas broegbernensis TaxID=83619 RepID=A0A7V8GLY0_9GAMM|nr:ATP-binding cassette domain-containing protein [Pseudoxanthomonas broegbernensis]KAF1686145.1 nitrate ABC transporter ATP-binding protein [Pseudoxanthomonas broegbernensis]MBB6063847.1 NitT/TauT family transport system ATP-binding protein [Pseudoxanthomonas broegbernensis]
MLELDGIALDLGGRRVLAGFALRLARGERLGLVGPSGAGKSSVLKLAAGLLVPGAGRVRNGFARPCLVFQEPRLLPWRSVRENLVIPLRAAGRTRDDARSVAETWLARVGQAGEAGAWPRQLSGGMAQRVALARAFALEPDLLLLDEPFGALDPELRRTLGALCDAELARTGAALVCVSHHPQELGERVDRCIRLEGGRAWPHALPGHAPRAPGRAPALPGHPSSAPAHARAPGLLPPAASPTQASPP